MTGGRGSGKSFAVNLLLLKIQLETASTILFTRYTMASAGVSIIPEFKEKIDMLNASHLLKINKNEIEGADSMIYFRGINTASGDQTANLKSLQGVNVWVLDESEELRDETIFDKIDLSVRANNKPNKVIMILNPTTKEHWIYKRFFESRGIADGYNGTFDDTTYIHTTYLDNVENLNSSFLKQVDAIKYSNEKKYKHVILGGWLEKSEGVIFTNWKIGDFDTSLTSVFGQDYGFSIDPSTLVEVAIDKKLKRIYVNEWYYKVGMVTSDIELECRRYAGNNLIIGDSAEGRLNEELRRKGLNVEDAVKIAVNAGIALMLDYEIIVTPTSINVIKELNNYAWSNRKSETPIDKHNHCLDSIRYAVVYLLNDPEIKRLKPLSFKVNRK